MFEIFFLMMSVTLLLILGIEISFRKVKKRTEDYLSHLIELQQDVSTNTNNLTEYKEDITANRKRIEKMEKQRHEQE